MSDLTDAAKAEIRQAIQIVREDRFEKYIRDREEKRTPPADPPKDPPKDPSNPPPPKDPPTDPPTPPTEKEYSRYWGEIIRD